jgi:glycosyltransferase involved in cell wall biosynthesis
MRALDLFKDKLSVVRFANLMQIDKPICNQKNSNQKDWDFIYFGRAEPYKGIDILFEAISLLSEKNIYPKILIISRNFSYKLIPDGVEIIKDYLSHEELASYISRSKWGVFPYTDATGTHTVQICNQCGVPVLASSVGSFEDYIIQDVNGALVPKSDPVALSLKIRSIMIGEIKTLERNHLIEWSSEYFSNFQSTIQFRKILVDAIDSAH